MSLNTYCPICGNTDPFLPFGRKPRPNAQCAKCTGLERHRLVWLFFQGLTNMFDNRPKRMLHFAPEPAISARIEKHKYIDYVTADLSMPSVKARLDIMSIMFPNDWFDVLYCSHVLEHVLDDRKAMRECCRVLKRDGWAVFLVPVFAKETIEDLTITDPKQRELLYGQHDHVRKYGPDFADRLRSAGFRVTEYKTSDIIDPENQSYCIPFREGPVYFCTKEQ